MPNNKLVFRGLAHAVGVVAYVLLLTLFFNNIEKIFAGAPETLAPAAMLLLFVFSAALTGALVLGKPILLYLENQKPAAIKIFTYTIGWLFVFMVIFFSTIALIK